VGTVATLPDFLDKLRAALILRSGLAGVNIFTAGIDDESAGAEAIVFAAEEVAAAGNYHTLPKAECFEEYPVEGWTWVQKPGAGEDAIKAARDRAFALLADVHSYLKSLGGTASTQSAVGVDEAQLVGWKLEQFITPNTRDAKLTFTIAVRAHFTPS
jgi:hypothetical protein